MWGSGHCTASVTEATVCTVIKRAVGISRTAFLSTWLPVGPEAAGSQPGGTISQETEAGPGNSGKE